MKLTRTDFSARYCTALRAHLRDPAGTSGAAALQLGKDALACKWPTSRVAHAHEAALQALYGPDSRSEGPGHHKRTEHFFQQALAPFEVESRDRLAANQQLARDNAILRAQSAALVRGYRRFGRQMTRSNAEIAKSEQEKERYRQRLLESQRQQSKLHQLTRRIISDQESERKKISRELHDQVVQPLVGINVELAALSTGTGPAARALRRKIAHTQRVVKNSVQAVHRFARHLRPTVLDDLGLIPALHAFSKNLATQQRLRIELTAFGGIEALNIGKRTVLFRVAQEALTNVARHAEATRVTLGISERKNSVVMEIADNGKAMGNRRSLLRQSTKQLGLIQMRERVEMIGGTLAIESTPERGTTIRTEIPFTPEPLK
jgi:signal transduction histidine kinase